jgi:hypothetical protein
MGIESQPTLLSLAARGRYRAPKVNCDQVMPTIQKITCDAAQIAS